MNEETEGKIADVETRVTKNEDAIEALRVRVNEILKHLQMPECYRIPEED